MYYASISMILVVSKILKIGLTDLQLLMALDSWIWALYYQNGNTIFANLNTVGFFLFFFFNLSHLQSRDPAVQAAILAQLNAKYGSGVLPDAPKDMSKASFHFCLCDISPFSFCLCYIPATAAVSLLWFCLSGQIKVQDLSVDLISGSREG